VGTEGSEVRTSTEKNLIFVSTLEALGLKISDRDGILKMIRGSIVVLKGI